MTQTPSDLVPGRECGECTYCCQYLPVDTDEIQHMPGLLCIHCEEKKGCTIYDTRPKICRSHFCGWRLSSLFDDSWRPDRCGILMTIVNHNIPPQYMQEGLELLLVHPKMAVSHQKFYKFIFQSVAIKVPLFICLRGPVGTYSAGVLLNPILEEPVGKKDEKAFMGILEALIIRLADGPFNRVALKHAGNPA